MATDDFIDIHKIDERYDAKIKLLESGDGLSKGNQELILRYLRESAIGKTLRKGQKRNIGAGRNLQVAGYLMLMARDWFKKDLTKVTMRDMETFIADLDQGKIKSARGGAYSSETKSNIKKFIRKFYKWLLTDNKFYPDLVEWIDTSKQEAHIEAIPGLKEGVWKIIELIPEVRRKALIWVAFDSGFREGELINCRIKDLEKGEDGTFYLTCRHSKTKPRSVSLPISSELLGRWLEQHPERNNREAQLWQTTRKGFDTTCKRYGEKAHKINVHPHMLRHTSATYWAQRLDRPNLCKRFGWSYTSNVPDRYIDMAKISEKIAIQAVKGEQIGELSRQFEDQKIQNQMLKDEMELMKKQLEALGLAKKGRLI